MTHDGHAPAARYPRSHVVAAFAAVYIVWGSTYLAIRYAVETMPPFLMAGARFLISGAILYFWTRRRGSPTPSARQWRDATIAGVLMLCFGNGAVAWAEQRVPSGLAALLVAVVPLWMVLVDWARPRGVRPRPIILLGVLVGFVGMILLVGRGKDPAAGSADMTAAVVLAAASLAWACGSVFNQHGDRPSSAAMSTGIQMLGGSAGLVLFGLGRGELAHVHLRQISAPSWIGWAYLVTFGSLVGFTAYIYLLQAVSPAKASTYAYVNPLVAVFLGWAIAGEPVTMRTLAAAAVILAGVAMITLVRRE
ncbi:MAG TPA: EamA family transporter [Gemmatimonadaceae bacterium]|jgi:drug/metabolite transporter (DMT)-like permease